MSFINYYCKSKTKLCINAQECRREQEKKTKKWKKLRKITDMPVEKRFIWLVHLYVTSYVYLILIIGMYFYKMNVYRHFFVFFLHIMICVRVRLVWVGMNALNKMSSTRSRSLERTNTQRSQRTTLLRHIDWGIYWYESNISYTICLWIGCRLYSIQYASAFVDLFSSEMILIFIEKRRIQYWRTIFCRNMHAFFRISIQVIQVSADTPYSAKMHFIHRHVGMCRLNCVWLQKWCIFSALGCFIRFIHNTRIARTRKHIPTQRSRWCFRARARASSRMPACLRVSHISFNKYIPTFRKSFRFNTALG